VLRRWIQEDLWGWWTASPGHSDTHAPTCTHTPPPTFKWAHTYTQINDEEDEKGRKKKRKEGREKEKEKEREKKKEKERKTDRQTDRQKERRKRRALHVYSQ
jgi:hypothetical protein